MKRAKKSIISILLALSVLPAMAQTEIDNVLKSIEANSTTLQALRAQMEAQKLGNRTGINLSNPEVEFSYLWGSPSPIGNRTDIKATQSFDFPTAYGHRNRIAKLENANIDILYKSERINLLLRAKQLCIELIYYNALAKEYVIRLDNARSIANSIYQKYAHGEANIFEKNKAGLNLTTVENERHRIDMECNTLLSELQALNGGLSISFTTDEFCEEEIPFRFDDWHATIRSKNPELQFLKGQIEIGQQQIKLNTALGLPKLTAGYMSEKIVGERFQGITVGISVPLWENKNKIKQAKAQVRAAEAVLLDTQRQFSRKAGSIFVKTSILRENAERYRNTLAVCNSEALLKKALDAGEMSLLNYLLEIEYYYDVMNKALEAERDFNLALAELQAVELY